MMSPARGLLALLPAIHCLACTVVEEVHPTFHLDPPAGWSQWGKSADHQGAVAVAGQPLSRTLADFVYDPFVQQERDDEDGDILIHYQSPLVDGDDVFMESKSGKYIPCPKPLPDNPPPCGTATWDQQIWSETRLSWESGALTQQWSFKSDWHPPPNEDGLGGWEPVFHAALAGRFLVVPGAGGTLFVVARSSGSQVARINPFDSLDPDIYVAGPPTIDASGNVYYNAFKLDASKPWDSDVEGAWLVKVTPDGTASKVPFSSLVRGAPDPKDTCKGSFPRGSLPWPPTPDAVPPTFACGAQRPPLNVAPAVAADGTIYTVSTAHFAHRYSYLIAVHPDLTPAWAASLRDRLHDGCGTPTLPPNGQPGGCRDGAAVGVDPATNELPAGNISDSSTASPVVAPDGTILYGASSRYNHAGGHLFQFSGDGEFLDAYPFGWDVTPAIYAHDGTFSVVIKENRYETGSYCNDAKLCPPDPGIYKITQLGARLDPEWEFVNTNTESCSRDKSGNINCVSDHPDGFEWCINAPAVDLHGTVYANGEDGVLYGIHQGGKIVEQIFLGSSVGAAYTPLSVDGEGRIYAENLGQLFVIGK